MLADDKIRLLSKALKRARLDFRETMARCRSGEAQIHDMPDAVGITSIAVSGPLKTLHIVAVGGELAAIPALGKRIEEFAVEMGCSAIETDGRLGFDRLYRQLGVFDGWRQVAVKYRKEV